MVEAIEGFGDVICSRTASGIETNVPRRITRHSPDGFEWGYPGSGPADFAFNILSCFVGEKTAKCGGIYQKFKLDFVAKLPVEGGVIKQEAILEWIAQNIPEAA